MVAVVSLAVFVLAVVGAILWTRRGEPGRQRQEKILLFALYFWILVFLQTILVAIVYALLVRQ